MASSTPRAYNNGVPRDDHVFVVVKEEPGINDAIDLCYHALSAGALTIDWSTLMGPARSARLLAELTETPFSSMSQGDSSMGYIGSDSNEILYAWSLSPTFGNISIAHNCLFSNYASLRTMLEQKGYSFQTTFHSEIVITLLKMVSPSSTDLTSAVRGVCSHLRGSYSFVFLSDDTLVAVRDPDGSRPLFMGLRRSTGGIVFTTENASLSYVKAHKLGDVAPGYLYVLDNKGRPSAPKHYFNVNAIPISPSQDKLPFQHFYLRLNTSYQTDLTTTPYGSDHGKCFLGIRGDSEPSLLCHHALKQLWSQKEAGAGAGVDKFENNTIPNSIITGMSEVGCVEKDIQPFVAKSPFGPIAIAHNGHFSNYSSLRTMLEEQGHIFNTTSHAEVVSHLTSMISILSTDLIGAIKDVCGILQGSYSMLLLAEDKLVAVRDPNGFRLWSWA